MSHVSMFGSGFLLLSAAAKLVFICLRVFLDSLDVSLSPGTWGLCCSLLASNGSFEFWYVLVCIFSGSTLKK